MPFAGPAVRRAALIAALALVAVTAACAGEAGDDGASATPDRQLTALVVNSEVVVGENRLVVGLITQENEELVGAEAVFRFYSAGGEMLDVREVPAESVVFDKSYTHTHEDGTVETHSAGESGVYVANVTFATAGQWALEIDASVDGVPYEPSSTTFDVLAEARTVAIGAPAPLSETLTLDDVDDLAEIDTSDPPIPGMHELTIAEAVTSGKPSLIVFATPAFCLSRVCGPTKVIVDDLFEQYGDRVNFVHVEPYDVARARAGEGIFTVPATSEWGLTGEPWVFVVDAAGNVSAKFEGIVTADELAAALEATLGA